MSKSAKKFNGYDEDVIEKFNLIKNESTKVPGVIEVDTVELPSWIDRDRYVNSCLPVFAKIRPSIPISSLVGLSYLIQLPTILPPLLYTKKSENVCGLFERYLDTVAYVRHWHTTDIFDPKTDGYKAVNAVRSMHRHILKVMNEKAEERSKPTKVAPNVWVSQYDMVVTQWAFYGLLVMYPKACGLHHITDEELYEVIYCWRVISYFIGIDDKFSLWGETVEKSQQLCHLIFDEAYRSILEKQDREAVGSKMADDIFASMTEVLGPFTAQAVNKYWFRFLGVQSTVHLKTWLEFASDYIVINMAEDHWGLDSVNEQRLRGSLLLGERL
ncbi:hypothetical protein Bhyg_15120 [Pseudolycoriella hygida]|uniref:ER-bound oxygenase mpaB/mpaB'/Rubber oxygenase catalytic domain-containing protein n=1 Tax=Pseudolycoriella hygida TaxID=35572 RepID=A0A9Q0MT47_9DIPT|nr:hypothetical protein Bhyg_15120 [Pseudolycoriella hygida]